MKIAVFSDVHSNLEAYGAFIADVAARGAVGELWCLGDVVGYGADPEACAALTAALAGVGQMPTGFSAVDAAAAFVGKLRYTVRGNHDAAALGDRIINYFNEPAREAALWTGKNLSPGMRRFLDGPPLTIRDGGTLLVHSSPEDPAAYPYILTEADAAAAFAATDATLIFYGHTHQPLVIAAKDSRTSMPLSPASVGGGRYLVNVGSVGQPRDGDARACYVIYDDLDASVKYVRVEYDVEAAAAKIREAGLPQVLADRLYHGW